MIDIQFVIRLAGVETPQQKNLVGDYSMFYRSAVIIQESAKNTRYIVNITTNGSDQAQSAELIKLFQYLSDLQKKETIETIDVYFQMLDDDTGMPLQSDYQLLNTMQEGKIWGFNYQTELRLARELVNSLSLEYQL